MNKVWVVLDEGGRWTHTYSVHAHDPNKSVADHALAIATYIASWVNYECNYEVFDHKRIEFWVEDGPTFTATLENVRNV